MFNWRGNKGRGSWDCRRQMFDNYFLLCTRTNERTNAGQKRSTIKSERVFIVVLTHFPLACSRAIDTFLSLRALNRSSSSFRSLMSLFWFLRSAWSFVYSFEERLITFTIVSLVIIVGARFQFDWIILIMLIRTVDVRVRC